MQQAWLQPTTLSGAHVELRPLEVVHRDALLSAAADGELWDLWFTSVPSAQTIDAYIEVALNEQAAGLALPFVVVDRASDRVIGSTRYCSIAAEHRRVEIGYTWYAQRYQRTAVNTESKLLLLTHAFEVLNVNVVQFMTHWHNHASRAAISRLGAHQDGVLRAHRIQADGSVRDTVVFSILQYEWPSVRNGLRERLRRGSDAR